jgi:hypothetical protein
MTNKEAREISKAMKEARKEALSSKESALKSLVDAGIATKTGRLRRVYK